MIHVIRFHGFQWVDLLLPLSLLGLLWERSGNPDGMVLLLFGWCFIKFWRHSLSQSLYAVLIGILVTILSTVINNEYKYMQGTSMAAPVVSGAAALIIEKDPTLTPEELKEKIMHGTLFQ